MFGSRILKSQNSPEGIDRLREALDKADAVVIGAGAFPLRQDLFIQENALTDTSTTLPKSIISMICIQAAFTPMILWKNIGRTGAGIFILTAILMRQSRCMRSCSLCLKVKTILF